MKQIPQQTIDRILQVDIVKEIQEEVTLRQRGANYVGVCPFHTDHSPSMYVSPAKGIFKCFVCGEGGNVIAFRQKFSNLTFPEACRCIAEKNGIEMPKEELSESEVAELREYETLKHILEISKDLYQSEMSRCASAMEYLMVERGIAKEAIEKYGIGYVGKGISSELKKMGYSEDQLIKAGILSHGDRGVYDAFRNRVMFPFLDKTGKVVGFTGRDMTGKSTMKYKNTGETKLFTKGKNIYGLFQAKEAIRKEGCVYIVEGQFDVIGPWNVGVKNVIGGSGTAFTDAQRRLVSGMTKDVIFVYDGDDAGIEAAKNNIPLFVKDGFSVRCVPLKGVEGVKDPGDLAKKLGEGTREWLKKHEVSYVEFLADALFKKEDNERETLAKAMVIMNIIANDSDLLKDKYISMLASYTSFDKIKLKEEVNALSIDKVVNDVQSGFNGLEFVDDYVDQKKKEIHLTDSRKIYEEHMGKEEPWLLHHGVPSEGQIQALSSHAQSFIYHNPDMDATPVWESDCLQTLKAMFTHGLKVNVETSESILNFHTAYIQFYGNLMSAEQPTDDDRNTYICRCAEIISYTDAGIQSVNMDKWAQALGIRKTVLKEMVKPYINERKDNKRKKDNDERYSNEMLEYSTSHVPSYVEDNEEYKEMLEEYKFYPVLNRKGDPVCYMCRTNDGFKRVGDFYMVPLMHVYNKDNKDKNRRIFKVNRAKRGGSTYLEWPSTAFISLGKVKEHLIMEEHLNLDNCTPIDYDRIWSCMSYGFKTCFDLDVLGKQLEDCFCFSNGIYHKVGDEWKFEFADELGLMYHDKFTYYSPAYSIVNSGTRYDKDPFEMQKRLTFIETPEEKRTTFYGWARLMNEVYKVNNNGKWAILYAFLAAFRSEIYPIDRTFTALFFVGQTESGKTQIAISVRSLFMHPMTPNFNLDTASDAAFFSILEMYRDTPVVMEEYNDEEVSPAKFQGLKACIYDGDGREKKNSSNTSIDTSAVNAPVILLGQEAPQRDDAALANRVILLQVDKKVSYTEHEQDVFTELKQYEKDGLSYLLLEILKLRPLIKERFAIQYRKCKRELDKVLTAQNRRSGSQNRLINTVSFFTTMCKLIENCTDLELPFTYTEFLQIAVNHISKQTEMITQSDKLGVFFTTLDTCIDNKDIINGRDFRIETVEHIHVADGKEIHFDKPTRIIYMNMKAMYDKYVKNMDHSEKPIKQSTLQVNIESNPAYLGKVKGVRFTWETPKQTSMEDVGRGGTNAINNMVVTVMEKQQRTTSAVVLDYDLLKKVMDIDFERKIME